MDQITIDDMKLIELEIMDEIDRVCRKEGFSYFLGYGSCLGAARHQGFIPWDDDMDIIMPRDDYERFVGGGFDSMKTVERYKLASYRDRSGIFPFTKVVDASTIVYDTFTQKRYATGVWVAFSRSTMLPTPGIRPFPEVREWR